MGEQNIQVSVVNADNCMHIGRVITNVIMLSFKVSEAIHRVSSDNG